VQPLPSIFHPAVALSTIGQLVIHLGTMIVAVRWARAAATGNEVGCAQCCVCVCERGRVCAQVVTMPYEPEFLTIMLAASGSPASKKFKPALLNTVSACARSRWCAVTNVCTHAHAQVVFLVETAQQVAVMTVNYKGRPFMLASTVRCERVNMT
jgi:hypothetical protein